MKPYCYLTAALLIMGTAMAQAPPADPPAGTQTQGTTQAQGKTTTSTRETTANTNTTTQTEMKMQSYKGTLVDASCATGGAASSTASTPSTTETNAGNTATGSSETGKSKHRKGEANRAEGASQGCSVSGNTSQFALKLDDGRTVKFDSVGNLRAQDALKSKKWQDAASSGKAIQAKVTGTMLDDKLMVVSIH